MKCNNGWSLVQKYELITTSSHFLASGFGDHSPGRTQITLRESRDGGVSHIIGYVFLSKRNGEINGRLHCTKQGGGCLTYVVDNQDVDELHETIRNYCSVREMRIGERRGTRTRGTDLINPLQDPGRGFATQGRTTEEGETELGMEKKRYGGERYIRAEMAAAIATATVGCVMRGCQVQKVARTYVDLGNGYLSCRHVHVQMGARGYDHTETDR